MPNNELTEEEFRRQLHEMDIYRLRTLGREYGVRSPTSLRVNELIDGICDIQYGRKARYETKRGRKPKAVEDEGQEKFLARVADGRAIAREGDVEGVLLFKGAECLLIDLEGSHETVGKLTEEDLGNYDLREGDLVGFRVENGERHIVTVNGQLCKDLPVRTPFALHSAIHPCTRIELGGKFKALDLLAPIGRGSRVLVRAQREEWGFSALKEIMKATLSRYEGMRCFTLLVDAKPEDITLAKAGNMGTVIGLECGESARKQAELAHATVERCKRLAEKGEDVLLAVHSLDVLSDLLAELPMAPLSAKQTFGAGRCFADLGSLTLIATCKSRAVDLLTAVSRVANAEWFFTEEEGEISADLLRSKARNKDKLLGEWKSGLSAEAEDCIVDGTDGAQMQSLALTTGGEDEFLDTVNVWLRKRR